MVNAVTGYCDLNPTPTAGIANFALRLADVKAKKVLIDGMNQLGSATTKGVTIDVSILKAVMISKAFKCGNATLAYANYINNNTLKALVDFTKPKLDKLAKEDVDDVCQQIHDAADANVAGATPYGIVGSDITDLQAAIDLYRARTGDTRQAIISKSQANEQAHLMIRELIDELLEGQLDKMVNTIEETQMMYWKGYFQAREIIDLGTTYTKLRATVTDENGIAQKSVTVYLLKSGVVIYSKKTDIEGKVSIVRITPDDYDLQAEKAGFVTYIDTALHFAPGSEKIYPIILQTASGITIIREYDIPSPGLINFDLTGVNGTPASMAIIEVTGPAGVRMGAVANPGDIPGPTHYDREAGNITITLDQFKILIGYGGVNQYLTAQNIGMAATHIKITFTNLEA